MCQELNKEYPAFIKYWRSKYGEPSAIWKPEFSRFTVHSEVQCAWEVWLAAKGFDYRLVHSSTADSVITTGILYGRLKS